MSSPQIDPLIDSLSRAVDAAPDDVRLRVHLAELLVAAGRQAEAVTHCAVALQHDPADAPARELMTRALAPQAPQTSQVLPQPPGQQGPAPSQVPPVGQAPPAQSTPAAPPTTPSPATTPPSPASSATPEASETPEVPAPTETSTTPDDFDWNQAEEDLGNETQAPFVSSPDEESPGRAAREEPDGGPSEWQVEKAGITLADVGGMTDVKNRLEASFLAPMRNPELRRLYGKNLRGGLLLYGPPGTGKTFIARAVAGQMGASFLTVAITDVLDPYIGNAEANLHNIFLQARRHAPCVLFLDELDAIGMKRSLSRSPWLRTIINQLLQELDGISSNNENLYVLAATNAPWDVDPALRRPGRLDRTLLVLPPDEPARATILHTHLRERPVEGIDLRHLARVTDGLTGADLAHLCDSAAEIALMDSVRTGTPRMIVMADLLAALKEIHPSTGPWFETARNVVEYADTSGEYAELRNWMQARRLL